PASQIAGQIRGLYPWPGCRVRLADAEGREVARVTLARARPAAAAADEGSRWRPGEIMASGAIMTAIGRVEIRGLQPEGKRPTSPADYRDGHPWQPGLRVESIL